jgi:hypothetical protein
VESPTREELERAINAVKYNRALGMDGIPLVERTSLRHCIVW